MSRKKGIKDSFYALADVENGVTVDKIEIPKKDIYAFSLKKTSLFDVRLDDIFIIKGGAGKRLREKLPVKK
jgi:hypothetical protein